MNTNLICANCFDHLLSYPDDAFDFAIVDPPYGIGASKPNIRNGKVKQRNGSLLTVRRDKYEVKSWDNKVVSSDIIKEIIRVSKNQIIWGVNYIDIALPGGRIVWDKLNGETNQYGCEIAYNSQTKRTDVIYYLWSGMMQGAYCGVNLRKAFKAIGDKRMNEKRIHPTQKPLAVYNWLFMNYFKPGGTVLDPFMGSGTGAIISKLNGASEYLGIEIDEEIFRSAKERIQLDISQLGLLID